MTTTTEAPTARRTPLAFAAEDNGGYLTMRQAAPYTPFSQQRLTRRAMAREFEVLQFTPGGTMYVHRDVLATWLRNNTTAR